MMTRVMPTVHLAIGLIVLLSAPAPVAADRGARTTADSLIAAYEASDAHRAFDAAVAVLDDYLAYAALQSPALRATFYNWLSQLEKAGYVGAPPDPVISYTYYIENVETRVGPQLHALRLRQEIPWFGTLGTQKNITNESAAAAYQSYESAKLELFYEVKQAYYDYYYLGRDIAITTDNLQLLTFWESIARSKYRVGLSGHPDVIKAQVELGKLEDRLRTLHGRVVPLQARLRAVANLPDSVQLRAPANIAVAELSLDRNSVLQQTLHNNPNLKALAHAISRADAASRLAVKRSRPSFFLGFDYIVTGDAINPAMLDSGKDAMMASVGMSVPIWFGANGARQAEARAQERGAQQELAARSNRMMEAAEQIVFEHDDALRKVRLYRDGLIPKAEQSLEANYTAYQAGEADFLSLLDAQRQLLDFQLEYERALSGLAINRAMIAMLTGEELAEVQP